MHGKPQKGALAAIGENKKSLSLSYHKSKIPPPEEELVELLRTFQGEFLSLYGIAELPTTVAEAIVETQYALSLEAKTISDSAAALLASHLDRKLNLYIPEDRFCGTAHIENEYCIELLEMEYEEE